MYRRNKKYVSGQIKSTLDYMRDNTKVSKFGRVRIIRKPYDWGFGVYVMHYLDGSKIVKFHFGHREFII